jgi:hypothetical protein
VTPFVECEQVVAGEVFDHRFLLVAVVDDPAGEVQRPAVLDLAGQLPLQDVVVDAREERADVRLQHPREPTRELVTPSHRGVRPLVRATRIAVGDERPLVHRLQHVAQCVMHHAVAVPA